VATTTGREPPELDTTTPDPGLFGPDSVSWRVHDDPAALVGGLRALMLQSLLPGVMHGFYVHTDARADPWGRLWRTAGYVNVVVYGTRAEAEAYAARVRQVHRALRLDRPEWLLWVHCAAVDSWLQGHRASGAPMTDAEADAYVAEQVAAARLVGCDPVTVPSSAAELRDYLTSVRPQLQVTTESREAVGKWRRAQLTSTQLSTYYVGWQGVNGLVHDLRLMDPARSDRDLHDAVLAHGSPPPRHLRTLLGL
jgi:uncharacterized protein (DUF2236 family)